MSLLLFGQRLHYERYYQDKYCSAVGGVTEHILSDKTRVDCLTDTKAIEVDFANKWAECIGQALHYGISTNKKPACLLIMEDPVKDAKYLERLKKVADRYCIDVYTIKP
jgi:hypothetical protein